MFFNLFKKKKLGVCFSGGGLKGFTHIGVIKALEELNVYPDAISGTSAGSIVGGLYALGVGSAEMIEQSKKLNVKDFLFYNAVKFGQDDPFTDKGEGFSPAKSSKFVEDFFISIGGEKQFSDTKIPLYIIATDLITGTEVIMTEGSIALAARASSAVPQVFTPVRTNNKLLVDGFVLNNMPADVLKDNGIDNVVSVNLKAYTKPGKDSSKYMDVVMTTIDIMSYRCLNAGIKASDLVLEPDLKGVLKADLTHEMIDAMVDIGYIETMKCKDEILKLAGKKKQ